MRRVLFTTISLLALTATTVLAADLPRRGPVYKAPVPYAAGYTWTGAYAGINGGEGFGNSDWGGFGSNVNAGGGLIGVTLGYNWQAIGSPWIFGLEGDIDWTNMRGSFANIACPFGCETRNNWLGTVRGRLGYAVTDRTMGYITGGLAVGDVHATNTGVGSVSDTKVGWTIGGGVETALAANWTAKLEYLYVDLGSVSCATCGVPSADFHSHIVRAGLNYRF